MSANTTRVRTPPTRRVRVLVANRPRLMREMVLATIADQTDIEVIGNIDPASNLAEIVEQARPDVLIITLEGDAIDGNALDQREQRLGECGFLIGRHPYMRILALAPERNREFCIGRSSKSAVSRWKARRREF